MRKIFIIFILLCLSCSANIFYKEKQSQVIKDDNGIIAKFLSDSLVVYVNKEGEKLRIIPNMVCFDKGKDELIKELFSSLNVCYDDYGGRVVFFVLFNDMMQVQEVRTFEPLHPSYKANDYVIERYVEYLKQTKGRWIRKENKQKWNLFILSIVI